MGALGVFGFRVCGRSWVVGILGYGVSGMWGLELWELGVRGAEVLWFLGVCGFRVLEAGFAGILGHGSRLMGVRGFGAQGPGVSGLC